MRMMKQLALLCCATSVVALTACGYDSSVTINQPQGSPVKPSPGPGKGSWRDAALGKQSEDPVVSEPGSRSDEAKACPERTLCVRAPYLGLVQLNRLALVRPKQFAIKAEDGSIRLTFSGEGTKEIDSLLFEADIINVDDKLLFKTDGRNVTFVASEIAGKGTIDTSPLVDATRAGTPGRNGGNIAILSPSVSELRLLANGHDGNPGSPAREVPAAESGKRVNPVIEIGTRNLNDRFCVNVFDRDKQCLVGYPRPPLRPRSELLKYGWTQKQINLAEIQYVIMEGRKEQYISNVVNGSEIHGQNAAYSEDGQAGGDGGQGGRIVVTAITRPSVSTESHGGKGAPGGKGYTQSPGKGVSFNVNQPLQTSWSFTCYEHWQGQKYPTGPYESGFKTVSCWGPSSSNSNRTETVKVAGRDGSPTRPAKDGPAGHSGVAGEIKIEAVDRNGFVELLRAVLPDMPVPKALE